MTMLDEKDIRGYRLKNTGVVCPVCATDEEKTNSTTRILAEDVIHDDASPMECIRCKKAVK
jgi:hypothetical protein